MEMEIYLKIWREREEKQKVHKFSYKEQISYAKIDYFLLFFFFFYVRSSQDGGGNRVNVERNILPLCTPRKLNYIRLVYILYFE